MIALGSRVKTYLYLGAALLVSVVAIMGFIFIRDTIENNLVLNMYFNMQTKAYKNIRVQQNELINTYEYNKKSNVATKANTSTTTKSAIIPIEGGIEYLIPEEVKGWYILNGVTEQKIGYPQKKWHSTSYLHLEAKIKNGRYVVYIGPKLMKPGYPDNGKVEGGEFDYPYLVDVHVTNKTTGEDSIILCVVTGSAKNHTYNKYPEVGAGAHPSNGTLIKNMTAAFDVESGVIQTGIAYPKSSGLQANDHIHVGHMDFSTIEFYGATKDLIKDNYLAYKVVVKSIKGTPEADLYK